MPYNEDSSDDDDEYYSSSGEDQDVGSSDDDDERFHDDDNTSEFQSINVYPPGQYADEEHGGSHNRSSDYDGSEAEADKRRKMIIGLGLCCCLMLILSIVFGVLAFAEKDNKPLPPQAANVTTPRVPPPIAPPPPPTTNSPTLPETNNTVPPAVPITEPPSSSPSISPSSFLQTDFVYPALSSTYIQQGLRDPQSNSPTILVENGNGATDAYALVELDVTSKIDNIFRRSRHLKGQFTGKATRSFMRLVLAEDPGSPPPKLTLFSLPQEDLKFLTVQEFNPVLAEELQSFRFSDLPHPAITGIANIDKNVFLPPPGKGDSIWVDITQLVDNAAAFGKSSVILMLQNRDAVQAPGTGTQFYSVNSNHPPALVVILDDTVPTISPVPTMSMAPSKNPSGSIYPTGIHSAAPSLSPTTSNRPTNKPSKLSSSNPTIAPTNTPNPSSSEPPSTNPTLSSAPSMSAKPTKVASGAPTRAPVASEFPTDTNCLPCPEGHVLKWSTATVTSMSETCGDLRIRLLYSEYAVIDATPAQCSDIVNTCGGCEARVACPTCPGSESFQPSTVAVNGVTCQEAQVTLRMEKYAYGTEMCTSLQNACTCVAPTNVCMICPTDQTVADEDFVLDTSTMGLKTCGELEIMGSSGYIDGTNCIKLKNAGVPSLCGCGLKSDSGDDSGSDGGSDSDGGDGSGSDSEQASDEPSPVPSVMASRASDEPSNTPSKRPSMSFSPSTSVAPSKVPSWSSSPSKSFSPSKQPSTSAAPSATPSSKAT